MVPSALEERRFPRRVERSLCLSAGTLASWDPQFHVASGSGTGHRKALARGHEGHGVQLGVK